MLRMLFAVCASALHRPPFFLGCFSAERQVFGMLCYCRAAFLSLIAAVAAGMGCGAHAGARIGVVDGPSLAHDNAPIARFLKILKKLFP